MEERERRQLQWLMSEKGPAFLKETRVSKWRQVTWLHSIEYSHSALDLANSNALSMSALF